MPRVIPKVQMWKAQRMRELTAIELSIRPILAAAQLCNLANDLVDFSSGDFVLVKQDVRQKDVKTKTVYIERSSAALDGRSSENGKLPDASGPTQLSKSRQ